MKTAVNDGCERLKTPDDFVQAVSRSTPIAFAEMCIGLTEADRKRFSKSAQELLQKARPKERTSGWPSHEGHMARLAILAVGPRSHACRPMRLEYRPNSRIMLWTGRESGPNPYEQAAVQILADRKPDWADDWLLQQIEGTELLLSWPIVRRLIREGVCRTPDSEGYVRLVARFGLGANFDEDPDLLEDAWRLLQVPTHAFSFVAQVKPQQVATWEETPGRYWPQIFYYYAHRGRIDRGRLLDELLKALWGEFVATERAGLMHFHELLRPTESERLERQRAYIDLLRNPAATTVTFALGVIKSLVNVDGLDAGAALKTLPAVFELTSKSQPKAALALLKTLARKHPGLKSQAIDVAMRGLSHREADVQLAAVKCLEAWRDDGVASDRLLELRGLVSPGVRPALEQLLSAIASNSEILVPPDPAETFEPQSSVSELRSRVTQIDRRINAARRLEESLAAIEVGDLPPPADIDASPYVLPGLSQVMPIADVEELIDAVAQAFEKIESPMEIERVLDGLSRFGLERGGDFMARTNALRKRIHEVDTHMRLNSLLGVRFIFLSLFNLLRHWLGIQSDEQPGWLRDVFKYSKSHTVPIYELLGLRAEFIRSRLNGNKCGPLLSLPTHEHGWIDSRVFVARLRSIDAIELERMRVDLRYALLRLAPDFREEAIREAAELPGTIGRLIRYALGDEVVPTGDDREWKAEWLAAGRARSPRGELRELEPLGLPSAANAAAPAVYRVRLDRLPKSSDERRCLAYTNSDSFVETQPAAQEPHSNEYPVLTIAYHLAPCRNHNLAAWGEAWLASVWPSNTEPFLAGAVQTLLLRLDSAATSIEVLTATPALSSLLKPECSWSRTAIYALWLAMFSRDADARAVAIDALVEGLLDGRAHPDPLADVLVEIARYDWAKLNRLEEGLRQVARISRWASLVISQISDRLIASWNEPPRDAHHILGIQLELLMEINGRLSEAAQIPLRSLNGGSKSAKLAKQLLALEGGSHSAAYRSALLEGVERRIARAEFVQNSANTGSISS